ncbi:MAG: leukotriene A4 hydrolase C-terminal domain-containing protein [Bacteroidetes bacterium]|nr:leukotriene A4 hydrolase C-terminal domain-containing protein [Bacteroidota bacterium]
MKRLSILSLFIFILILTGCKNDQNTDHKNLETTMKDPHSYGNPDEVIIRHLDWTAVVNFEAKTLSATAVLTIENLTGTDSLVLDTRDLAIESITLGKEKEVTPFRIGQADSVFGAPLTITIKPGTNLVTISYQTKPEAAALQWLSPAQTLGKKTPFLFTQSQAILARTWIPLQDGPQVRFTYSAQVSVPPGMLALMSASNPQKKSENGVYQFKMEQPIPSYLMALAVGDIEFKPVGKRCGIYAEPAQLEAAAWEFSDTEKMVEAAEQIYGPYRWDRYDVLVLPPSFPFGGMENPRLTFATPTVIAGDKSLVALIAHELAHSWSGNLVTNAVWDDFWLNEGFTVYFEGRIMEHVYGRDFAEMEQRLGFEDLKATMAELGDTSRDSHLKLDLKGRDPDEGVSDIAYEKGANFLRVCEKAAGREKWDTFVKGYFEKYAFTSMTTEKFITYFEEHFIAGDSVLSSKIRLKEWIYGPGIPDNVVEYNSVRLLAVDHEIKRWNSGTKATELNAKSWATPEWLYFLRGIPHNESLERMEELDKTFHFSTSGNSEILAEWLEHSIQVGYKPAYPAIEKFLTTVGRRKFLKPLYQQLLRTNSGKELAWSIYVKARPGYHSVAVKTIDEMIGWSKN